MKKLSLLVLFFLITSLLPTTNIVSAAPDNIYLIKEGSDYIKYGFKDLGVYYTPEALCEFHMPFIVPKNKGIINKNQLSSSIVEPSGKWDKKQPSYKYDILAENKDYYVIDYSMNVKANTEKFSIDFVPVINGKQYKEFAYWSSSWDKRGQFHINNSQIDTELTNFPILINFSQNTSFHSFCQSDLDDLRFVSSDNTTEFYHEIEDYSFDNSNNWVNVSVWVQIDRINDDSDTYVNVYYHNDNCGEQGQNTSVWDSDYLAVYHFDTGGTTLFDSTSNNNDGTTGTSDWDVISGMGSPAYDFTEDTITLPTILSGTTVDTTYEIFYKADHVPGSTGDVILGNDRADNDYTIFFELEDSGFKYVHKTSGDAYDGLKVSTTDTSSWHGLTGTCDANVGLKLYFDGEYDSAKNYAFKNYNTDWKIGSTTAGARFYNGKLTELRVSTTLRNESWINASYNNLNNISSEFLFISSLVEEGVMSSPSGVFANTTTNSEINLSWDKGDESDYTYIERHTSSSWNFGDGTQIYNNTGTLFTDTDLSQGVIYYYKFWGYNSTVNTFSNPSSSINNITAPSSPTGVDGSLDGTTMNITWTKGSVGADRTVIIQKSNSYPSSVTDGNLLYNGTSDGYNDTGALVTDYYTLYSFNSTVHQFSSGTNLQYGSLTLNVYDEDDYSDLSGWGVFIKNSDGSTTYSNTSCTNALILSTDQLPTGDDCAITINMTGYTTRTFYMDIAANTAYSLDAYLSVNTSTETYYIRVINDYAQAVDDARIEVKRVLNESYEYVGIVNTDANGYATLNLVPDLIYLATTSASGYTTENTDLYPVTISYEAERYLPPILLKAETEDFDNITSYEQNITFNGYISGSTMYINFSDNSGLTIDTNIYVYEINASTGLRTLYSVSGNPDSRTADNSFQLSYTVNTSNCYDITLHHNHSIYGGQRKTFSLCVTTKLTTSSDFDSLWDNIMGSNPFGWANTFGIFIMMAFLFSFGSQNAGVALLLTGFIMIGLNTVIGLTLIGVVVPTAILLLGLLTQYNVSNKGG